MVVKNIVEGFEKKKRKLKSHTLYIDMEKNFKFSEFVNVLKIFNENLDIVNEFFSQKRICGCSIA